MRPTVGEELIGIFCRVSPSKLSDCTLTDFLAAETKTGSDPGTSRRSCRARCDGNSCCRVSGTGRVEKLSMLMSVMAHFPFHTNLFGAVRSCGSIRARKLGWHRRRPLRHRRSGTHYSVHFARAAGACGVSSYRLVPSLSSV